jgi:hypothetical protein
VKVLSPVNSNVKEVDSFHLLEDRMIYFVLVRDKLLFRGLSPWHDAEWRLQELGRPCKFRALVKGGTCRLRQLTHTHVCEVQTVAGYGKDDTTEEEGSLMVYRESD